MTTDRRPESQASGSDGGPLAQGRATSTIAAFGEDRSAWSAEPDGRGDAWCGAAAGCSGRVHACGRRHDSCGAYGLGCRQPRSHEPIVKGLGALQPVRWQLGGEASVPGCGRGWGGPDAHGVRGKPGVITGWEAAAQLLFNRATSPSGAGPSPDPTLIAMIPRRALPKPGTVGQCSPPGHGQRNPRSRASRGRWELVGLQWLAGQIAGCISVADLGDLRVDRRPSLGAYLAGLPARGVGDA
jgi:hypothetical protein